MLQPRLLVQPPQQMEKIPKKQKKPKSKKMLFIIIGVVVLLIAAVGGYMYMKSSEEARKIQEAEAKRPENILKKQLTERKQNAPPIYIPLEEMIVNLPGRGGEHYLQAKNCSENE
jgi:flagellar protein FliL